MTQVKIRQPKGMKLEQLTLPVQELRLRKLERITRYERAILRILQRRGPMTAAELKRATKLSMSTVTARLSELGEGGRGKGLIKIVKTRIITDAIGRERSVYVYDLSEKGWLLVESTA